MKIGDLFIKLGLQKDGFDKGIDDAKRKTSTFGGVMSKVGPMIAGAFAVSSIVAFGKELFGIAQKAEGIQTAFSKIASQGDLNMLKSSVKGTVSELELMQRAVQANNFGIPVKNLGKLFEFATKRAQDTGQSVDYLVDSIVLGIGRKSPLILDNLGISAIQLKSKLGGVGIETASVGDIAEAVGAIAQESFRKTGGIIDTVGIKSQRLGASWENMKVQMSSLFSNADWLKNDLDDWSKLMEIWQSDTVTKWEKFRASISGVQADGIFSRMKKTESDNDYLNKNLGNEGESSGGPLGKKPVQVQNVKAMKAELEALNSELELINIKDTKSIDLQRVKIKALDDQIKKITEVKEAEKSAYEQAVDDIKKKHEELDKIGQAEYDLFKKQKGDKAVGEIPKSIMYYEAEIALLEAKKKLIIDPQILAQAEKELRVKKDLVDLMTKESKFIETKKLSNKDISDVFSKGIKTDKKDGKDASELNMDKSLVDSIAASEASADAYEAQIKNAQGFIDSLNETLSQGIADAISNMAEGFAQLLTGDMGWKDFGNMVLSTIGAFLVQMGGLIIAYGVAMDAFKKAFSNPYIAIAAGAALVFIGSAISGLASKGASGGGGGGGYSPSSSSYNGNNGSSAQSAMGGKVVFELQGTTLKGVLNNTDRKNSITR